MASILDKGFAAQAESLRQFGYPDVTADMVRAAHADWMAGKPATDVIAMFCESAFNEYPTIFGTPASDASASVQSPGCVDATSGRKG